MIFEKFAKLKSMMGFTPIDMMSFRSKDRAEFITLFAQLTAALPAGYFGLDPYIYMTGGLRSGKSLASEVMAKTLDDDYNLDNILNEKSGKKYFLEKGRCQTTTSYHNTIHKSQKLSVLFNSALSFDNSDLYFTRQEFKKAVENTASLTILTGWTKEPDIAKALERSKRKPSLILDLGRRGFEDTEPRTTRLAVIDPALQNDESFQEQLAAVKHKFAPKALSIR